MTVDGKQPLKQMIDYILAQTSQELVPDLDEFNFEPDVEFDIADDQALYRLTSVQMKVIFQLLPTLKHRRQHLHLLINRKRLDCTHVTDRIGSPHVLVRKKMTAFFAAAQSIYLRD